MNQRDTVQVVVYDHHGDNSVVGLYYADVVIDNKFLRRNVYKMVKEYVPHIHMINFMKSFRDNDSNITPHYVSVSVFAALQRSTIGLLYSTRFTSCDDETMDGYTKWDTGITFDVLEWLCDNGTIEKIPYVESRIE